MKQFANEGEYLIHLVVCVMKEEQPLEMPEGLDFEKVYSLACYHSVANIAYYGIEKLSRKPEEELLRKWSQVRDKAIIKDLTQQNEYEQIATKLSEEKMWFIPLKGMILKRYYPQSDFRTMSDIDLLIDEANAPVARKVMFSLGYEVERYGAGAHDVYLKKPVMNVEIHRQLFGVHAGKEYNQIFRNILESCNQSSEYCYEMEINTFFVYMIAHAAKHYDHGGTGLRSFLDIWVFLKKFQEQLDWSRIDEMLQVEDMQEKCHDFMQLPRIFFEDAPCDGKYEEMKAFVMHAGTYGTLKEMVQQDIQKKGKAGYVFRQIFPTVEMMKSNFPILKKAPVLLPFVWLYRLLVKPVVNYQKTKKKLQTLMGYQKDDKSNL